MKKIVKFLVAIALIPYVLFKEFMKDSIRNEQLRKALENRYERFKADTVKFTDPQILDLLRRVKIKKDVCELYAKTIMNHNPVDTFSDFSLPYGYSDLVYWETAEKTVREEAERRSLI